ncbi:CLUMA_CG011867, isoform A [Clunio marinus]|uniref:Fatty acyl-CoA reductase n=1 Tax=Clunio marinus TaxID=568069 RepID=A0A1J1IE09_9DIPT|nr:CLUMA_CG011867, isoform A [Clunio marinus]
MEEIKLKSIEKFYEGAEIFITGGTGFVGKVLIEKLLRSCPNIKTIYLLIRRKKGKNGEERIQELVTNNKLSDFVNKLHAIDGDVMEINLGISNSDREKLKACSVIFHAAASVRFNDPLRKAILLNTRGTRETCKLATELPNLKSFVHVSTAYIEPRNLYVEEKVYPIHANWRTYINYAENVEEEILNFLTPKLTKFAPNTYTFTKHLAEHVCIDYMKEYNLPVIIYRPSIVTASEVEPVPGYLDNLNGPVGLIIAAQLGLYHVSVGNVSFELNMIPVDICVKGMIVASVKNAKQNDEVCEIEVINAASIKHLTVLVLMHAIKTFKQNSLKVIDVTSVTFTSCTAYAWMIRIFRQIIPSVIIDSLLKMTKNEPRLMKIQRLIFDAERNLKYFQYRKFKIPNHNFHDLNLNIPLNERKDFMVNEVSFNQLELMGQVQEVIFLILI